MQSINNLQEIIKVYQSINKKDLFNFSFQENICIMNTRNKNYNFVNNTKINNCLFTPEQLNLLSKIVKLNKDINFDFEIENNKLLINSKTTKYELVLNKIEMIKNIDSLNDFENKTYIGRIEKKQILEFNRIFASLTFDKYRDQFHNIFIHNNQYFITDSFILITDKIDLKDCIINCIELKNFKNSNYIDIYKDNNKYYYESNNFSADFEFNQVDSFVDRIVHYKDLLKKPIVNMNIDFSKFNLNIKNKANRIEIDFKNNIAIISNEFNENEPVLNYEFTINSCEILTEIDSIENKLFFVNRLKTILENSKDLKNINISFGAEYNSPVVFDNNILMPVREENKEVTKTLIKDIKVTKVKYFEPVTKEIEITKEITEVTKEVKTKKPKSMNLKKEIKLAPKKSKYYAPVTEVIEPEVIEIENNVNGSKEIVKYNAPEVKKEIKQSLKSKQKQVKQIYKELSETVITENFDYIDFIYKACFTDLENLSFYNTDYKNSRLYLNNCELTFVEIKNKIEVIELDADCNIDIYEVKDKRELLNIVRSKIKAAA